MQFHIKTFIYLTYILIQLLYLTPRVSHAADNLIELSISAENIDMQSNNEDAPDNVYLKPGFNGYDDIWRREESSIPQYNVPGGSTPEIIQFHGYPVEIHQVLTEDGYVLELHRIPWGFNDTFLDNRTRPVVFLQHCLLCSSSDWIINSPDKALGFILADKGFDVWLGNARGNTYSRKHQIYTAADKEFWDFSWDEIAYYDVPASLDYVLGTTNSTKLSYIGFSMGTLVFFGMMSEKPEYNEKVNTMIALGPVAFLENVNGPLSYVTRYVQPIKLFTEFFGIYEVLPGGMFLDLLTSIMCDPFVTKLAPICDSLLLKFIGMDTHYTNRQLLTQILAHTPAGTSVKNMIHFMQAINSGRFEKFNYGPVGNRRFYNSPLPPSYALSQTIVPVAVYWAKNDWFAHPRDVEKLAKHLPNVVRNKKVPDETFSHVDFLWSDNSVKFIYMEILDLLYHYN